MSLGALSPEAHQALTIGLRRLGMAPNSGEGGEDPAWYDDVDGIRHDAAIKQVASARFGVTAQYLARAEQLEIKIAQGSKPGEGGQLPSKKVTPLIARLRRAQTGISLISPPPHHDIYSIEDLAQLIADLRAINPGARIGVKLVAALGIGTIAAGVAKAGADYIQVSGHVGGTGASPLSSIKHVGIPWELGLAEVHQVLMRNDLRDRVALRTDGGLQTGRDVVVAALLGAEEFGFGTAGLIALGCDMARQCHLDTCPTGIATQREDLRAKFTGTPEDVVRYFTADRGGRPLGAVASGTQQPRGGRRRDQPAPTGHRPDCAPSTSSVSSAPRHGRRAADRRADPCRARTGGRARAGLAGRGPTVGQVHAPARRRGGPDRSPSLEHPVGGDDPIRWASRRPSPPPSARSAPIPRGSSSGRGSADRCAGVWPGAAGQSFGAFSNQDVSLELVGQANDYVGKGLSGGTVVVRPEDALLERAAELAIAGNACLYGATGGRLHLVGRAGIRFAVRNSGASAVVEGVGAHGCEYMTGGVVVILGGIGPNFGAGMTGGRAYLWDPSGASIVTARTPAPCAGHGCGRWSAIGRTARSAPPSCARSWSRTATPGPRSARTLLARPAQLGDGMWLIEPIGTRHPHPDRRRRPRCGSDDERCASARRLTPLRRMLAPCRMGVG